MQKRKLEELNLLDDFLFGSMVTYPKLGEEFVRILLRIICGKEFGRLKVIPQRTYYGSDTGTHGARLDVYLEEEPEEAAECVNAFDIEPNRDSRRESVAALPKRVRFYHAVIDAQSLEAGVDYLHMKNVMIIMILPYDPFGKGRMMYTVRRMCEEDLSIPYEDGARTLYLYTRGTEGNPPKELRELLRYMEKTVPGNACSPRLKKIQRMVERVKKDKEVLLEYMKIFEREQMLVELGKEEGSARILTLIARMTEGGEGQLIPQLAKDKELLEQMYKKYGLQNLAE